MTNAFSGMNMDKFMATLSELLSEQYGCKITIRAIPKNQAMQDSVQKTATREQKTEASEKKAG